MDPVTKPSVLFVYYSYTPQTLKVVEAMAEVLRDRGCEVQLSAIGFVDPRYDERFEEFPMPHPFRELVGMIPAEALRKTGKSSSRHRDRTGLRPGVHRLPHVVAIHQRADPFVPGVGHSGPSAQAGNASRRVACRRYWKHNLKTVRRLGRIGRARSSTASTSATKAARCARSCHSCYLGRASTAFLGVKIPPTNLQDYHLDQAREFAGKLADELVPSGSRHRNGRPTRQPIRTPRWAERG
jgi:hypothetical protein